MRLSVTMVSLAAALLAPTAAMADTVYVPSELKGWINSAGGQFLPEPTHNMYTGNENGLRFNSYAAFYIPDGKYTSATLTMNPSAYGSAGPSLINFYDFTSQTLLDLLNTTHPGTDAYADLGSGTLYGSATLFDTEVTTGLTSGFIQDLNSAASATTDLGHFLIIGFTNTTLNALPADSAAGGIYVGGVGFNSIPLKLTLEAAGVPEPATWAMMIAGFGMVGAALRRRQRVTVRFARSHAA